MSPDLNRLRQFGQELAPPRDRPPEDLRRRVLAPAPVRRRAIGLRWRLSVATVAAAVAAIALLLPSAPLGSVARGIDAARPAKTAQQILQQAASRAALGPELTARGDQFIFLEWLGEYLNLTLKDGSVEDEPLALVQEWRSVDGTRDGVVRDRPLASPGARWHNLPTPGCPASRPRGCEPVPGIDVNLPTDADAMYAHLYRPLAGDPQAEYAATFTADEWAFIRAIGVLFDAPASNKVQAALFSAMARLPGVRVSPQAMDVSGRTGTGLVHEGRGGRTELIFDSASYRYLGMNRILAPMATGGPFTVRLPVRTAIQRVAVVGYLGDLP